MNRSQLPGAEESRQFIDGQRPGGLTLARTVRASYKISAMSQVTVEQAMQIAVEHHQAGRVQDAESICRQILAVEPNHAESLHLLGLIAGQLGRIDAAVNLIRQAIVIAPGDPHYHCNLGILLQSQSQIDRAIACFERALDLKSDYPEAHNSLGLAWMDKGQIDQAVACFQRALAFKPDYAEAHSNLGNAWWKKGQIDQAIACCQRAANLKPDNPEIHNNLGVAWQEKGQRDQAIACYQRALSLNPNYPEACNNLGAALSDKGQLDEAIITFQRALTLRPDYPDVYNNLGNVWKNKGQTSQAIDCFQRALSLRPENPEFQNNLGVAWREMGQLDDAIACSRRALSLKPDYPSAYNNLGNAWKDKGQLDEAIACYERGLALRPDDATIGSNRIYAMYFHPRYNARTIQAALGEFNTRWKQPIRPHENERSPDRRLKIGYVSPDLREHVVGWNLLPLMEQHDHQRFEIVCYSDVRLPDAMTERIRAQTDQWRSIRGTSDDEAAAIIREDRIDVLVDLSAHMAYNRLLVFARKPAPIQITYLGYCGSTGLDAVDYRFSDPYLDPPGTDHLYREKTIRLPTSYWCYRPGGATPDAGPLPERITFACLNNFAKVSAAALDLWKQILLAVPGTRLLINSRPGSHREAVAARFGDAVEFVNKQPWEQYVATYQRASISLDPFPYGGGITACDSLWMGVPVVTLSGTMPVGRAGRTLLSQIGLQDLVAETPERYQDIAVKLAGDRARLAELRRTLRHRMECSPLMDAERFARDVEDAYRTAWRKWCENE